MGNFKEKDFFLVIPTRERKQHLINLLKDLNHFAEHISHCVVVDQSETFIGNDFNYKIFSFKITILQGDRSKGVNHSRNLAMSCYNKEDWLFFLDDDLRVEPKELNKLIDYQRNYTYDVIVPGINETRKRKDNIPHYATLFESLCKPQSYDSLSNRIVISSGLSLVSAKYFFKAGSQFDETFTFWGDDWDFGLRLYKVGATIKFIPEINFTHLKVAEGGQRSFKELSNEKRRKKELEFYLIKKHFGTGVLKEIYVLSLLKELYKLKFKNVVNNVLGYKSAIKNGI